MKTAAKTGAGFEATELGDQTGVATVVDPTDEQEQRAGRMPWLTICNRPPDRPSVLRAKVPITMKPRWRPRSSDETLEVLCIVAAIAQMMPIVPRATAPVRSTPTPRGRDRCRSARSRRCRAEHDAGQDHRTRRGVGVGVGQPGVHREQRNLHGERNGEAQEDQRAVVVASACSSAR